MLKCLALAIYFHVKDEKNLEEDENKIPEIFDERIYPLTKERQSKVIYHSLHTYMIFFV